MSSDIKKLSTNTALPATPDISLSAAFRHVLGAASEQPHLPASTAKRGQELAKSARGGKPAGRAGGAPGKIHIGPRSGHK